jgi:hypothetical protein
VALAAKAEYAGFWPVIRLPSTWGLSPILSVRVEATESLQFILDQERDDIGELSTSIVKIPSVFRLG